MNDLEDFGKIGRNNNECIAEEACINSKEEEKNNILSSFSQWAIYPNGIYQATSITNKKLPSKCFQLSVNDNGLIFIEHKMKTDDLIQFEDEYSKPLLKEINNFWGLEKEFENFGFLHKRGIILHGPAGSGKTCIIHLLINDLINNFDGIVLICDCSPNLVSDAIKQIKQIEPKRKIICLFEDIDTIIRRYGESSILSLLDGETQINNVLNLATTNYPEILDKRIVSRPRRFDRRIKIDMPSENVRKQYLTCKLKNELNEKEINKWVSETNGFSFAAMTELIVLTKCLGNSFEKAISDIRNLINCKISSEQYEKNKVGFAV